jgi:hypothetical protein
VAGVCDPATGACSNPAALDGTSCDADSNGCTDHDHCSAGTCVAGAPGVCATPPGQCWEAVGACSSTGPESFECSYAPKLAGEGCDDADPCTQVDACDGAGHCVGADPVTCTGLDACHLAGACDSWTGFCSNPAAPDDTPCDDGDACTRVDVCRSGVCQGTFRVSCRPPGRCEASIGCDPSSGLCAIAYQAPGAACDDGRACTGTASQPDQCDGAGACVGGAPACGAGKPCREPVAPQTGPQCADTRIVPQVAKLLELATLAGLAMDGAGSTYATGTLTLPAKSFDGTTLASAGAGDVFVGKYDASGALQWALSYGDASDQQPAGITVGDLQSSRVLASGRFSGSLGPLAAGAARWDYLLFLNASTGAIATARSVDTGSGAILATGANPALGLFAVCGKADKLALDTTGGSPGSTWATVAGAGTYGGATDILVGLYGADGTLRWAKQIGTTADEECDAITVDDAGNVVAAGKYSGSGNLLLAGSTPLPNPGSAFRRHIWVARFDGVTGAGLAQRSFGGGNGQHQPNAVSVDAAGNVFIAGYFSYSLPFGAATGGGATSCTAGTNGCLASAGGLDGFVAKLDPSLAPIWMTRIGDAAADDAVRGLAIDSSGDPVVGGLLNGTSTASTITPTTAETAPVSDGPSCVPGTPGTCALTSAGPAASSFVAKLPGATGLFDPAAGRMTGDAITSNTNRVAVNAKGTGAVLDAVSFGGELAGGTLDFGTAASPLPVTPPSGAATFLVIGRVR